MEGIKVKRKNTSTTQKYVENTLKMFVLKNTKQTKNPHQTKQQLSYAKRRNTMKKYWYQDPLVSIYIFHVTILLSKQDRLKMLTEN